MAPLVHELSCRRVGAALPTIRSTRGTALQRTQAFRTLKERPMRNFLGLTIFLFNLLALSSAAGAQQAGPYYGHAMWDGGGWMFFGPLMMIIFIALIIGIVVLIVRWLGGAGHAAAPQPPSGKTPLDILNERFARGEIDKDDFEERRRTLGD